jgi:hypothetical protein
MSGVKNSSTGRLLVCGVSEREKTQPRQKTLAFTFRAG